MTQLEKYSVELTPIQGNEIILQPLFTDSMVASDFTQYPNVQLGFQQKMVFFGNMQDPLRSFTGCDMPSVGISASYDKTITVDPFSAKNHLCYDDFKNSLLALGLMSGNELPDFTNTTVGLAANRDKIRAVQHQIQKVLWFGDKTNVDATINITNGWWKHVQNAVLNGGVHVSTYSNTVLSAGEAILLMREVVQSATVELRGVPVSDKVIYISSDVRDALENDIEDNLTNDASYRTAIENGIPVTRYKGIEVRVMENWPLYAAQYLGLTTAANLVLYTAKGNLAWANDGGVRYESWYEKKEELVYFKTRFAMGTGLHHEKLVSAAF